MRHSAQHIPVAASRKVSNLIQRASKKLLATARGEEGAVSVSSCVRLAESLPSELRAIGADIKKDHKFRISTQQLLEQVFNEWVKLDTEGSQKVSRALFISMKILGAMHKIGISFKNYLAVMSNISTIPSISLAIADKFMIERTAFSKVSTLENGSRIYHVNYGQLDEDCQGVFFLCIPKKEDIAIFARGALNTQEDGFSSVYPGAVAILSGARDINTGKFNIRCLQGLSSTKGPFRLNSSQRDRLFRYKDCKDELLFACLRSCEESKVPEVVWRGMELTSGGMKSQEAFKKIVGSRDTGYDLVDDSNFLGIIARRKNVS